MGKSDRSFHVVIIHENSQMNAVRIIRIIFLSTVDSSEL